MNELFKSEKIQIESTSFTVSEPVSTYTIEPLIYKYALDNEKKILKEKYNVCEFDIDIIKLERIFIDKIFAIEFYYEREMYEDVSKHLYDISIMIKNNDIIEMLNNKQELNKLICYKRKEEESRIGGIDSNKQIKDFNKMQRIYVLDDESMLTIDEVKNTVKRLFDIFDDTSF